MLNFKTLFESIPGLYIVYSLALPPQQGGQIPAIALTAYAGELDQQQAIAAGFQRHVAKPIDPEVLVAIAVEM
ncbi:MAG: hypothetical protein V7K25_24830 [Nostoc sp.]|uniref:hypothetical protein n=1 Tax=Nostoc sp. TaxID=1180 RepID=UPI002FF8919B